MSLVATHGGPEAVLIFLATDDEHFVSSARERLGTARVQMQAAGAVMRGSADKPTWQDNRGSRNLQRGMLHYEPLLVLVFANLDE